MSRTGDADGSASFMRFFPYEGPYPAQRAAMEAIATALARDRDVLFEGACGTGKTLAALAPALAAARESGRTVVITTNVHQQMRQFVTEARAIAATEPIRAVVFRGKRSMCHIDVGYDECQTLRDASRDVIELEEELASLERRARALRSEASTAGPADDREAALEGRAAVVEELERVRTDLEERRASPTCERFERNLREGGEGFDAWLFDDVRTPDEVYDYAHERGYCGYELLKATMGEVDLVICNYHHLLDPFVRERFLHWLRRDPDEIIAVFDEAHNVEAAAREHASVTLAGRTVGRSLDELDGVANADAEAIEGEGEGEGEGQIPETDREAATAVVGAFHRALLGLDVPAPEDDPRNAGGSAGSVEGPAWTDVAIANEDGRDDLTVRFLREYDGRGIGPDLEMTVELGRELERSYEERYRTGEIDVRRDSPTRQVGEFLAMWLEEGDCVGRHPLLSVARASDGSIRRRVELLSCLPDPVTRPLFDELAASVLMSATLRPFPVTSAVLGLDDAATVAHGLSFPQDRRRTFAVDTPPLFASDRDDPTVQAAVDGVLEDAIRLTPGNTLCFFPSYAEAARYHGRLVDRLEGPTFLDEPGRRVEERRRDFVEADGASLFTSIRGTLTEGVSFDGDAARTVAVVGVPYPRLDERTRAVERAYGERFSGRGPGEGDRDGEDVGWRYAVEIPTIRKTRQALGRIVRSPEDFGVRLLVDGRYTAAGSAEFGRYAVHDTFPPDERQEIVDVAPERLKFAMANFFGDLDAYDAGPPIP